MRGLADCRKAARCLPVTLGILGVAAAFAGIGARWGEADAGDGVSSTNPSVTNPAHPAAQRVQESAVEEMDEDVLQEELEGWADPEDAEFDAPPDEVEEISPEEVDPDDIDSVDLIGADPTVIDGHSLDAADGSPTDVVFVDNAGSVGVGTTAPEAKLHVIGNNLVLQEFAANPDFVGRRAQGTSAAPLPVASGNPLAQFVGAGWNGTSWGTSGYMSVVAAQAWTTTARGTDLRFYTIANNTVSAPERMRIAHDGNVGIGIATPSMKLHVVGNRIRLGSADGVREVDLRADGGAVDLQANKTDLYLRSSGGTNKNRIIMNPFSTDGNVGVGTTNPQAKLHVKRNGGPPGGALALEGTDHAYLTFFPDGFAAGRKGWLGYGSAGDNNVTLRNDIGGANIVLTAGTGGRVVVPVIEITGADLAEKFPVSGKVEPGMVVEIDPSNPGKLRLSQNAYNRRVAGVVGGANGLSVGAILGNLPGHEDAPAIALSGRVYVKCDTSNGPIEPGNLLTTSDTPGNAMKVTDHARAQGAIIGKAMSSVDGETGMVLVLVSLQ